MVTDPVGHRLFQARPPPAEIWVNPDFCHLTHVATYVRRQQSGLTQFSDRSRASGGKQHGQRGGVGVDLGINTDLADQLRHRAFDVRFDPGGAMIQS
jgi:hypothetical protein